MPPHFRRPLLICCVILVGASLVLIRELKRIPKGNLTVQFFDVGQGDAALLTTPSGKTVLIDGGPDLSALEALGKSLPLSHRSIDLLILSHPDPDHFTAFPEVFRRFKVGALLLPAIQNDEEPYKALLAIVREQGVPLVATDPQRDIDLQDGVMLDILWPPNPVRDAEDNDNSIVLRAIYGTGSILFTGDLSEKGEEVLLASGIDVSAQVLKVGHHGSRFSSSEEFLAAVHPRLSIISVGRDNDYGHPHPDTLQRLQDAHIPMRSTAQEGEIQLVF
ncbi:MAG: ComEC/Rec2 family competence protein [Candidatus Peregrinibacteria bacterium]